MDKQYLDIEGGKHLTDKLKSYVQSKIDEIPDDGTVDLTDYYTKEEVNKIVSNISTSGGSGTGKDGVGIASIKLVDYELVITLTDGTEHNLGNVRGATGEQGEQGIQGDNGDNGVTFTPTVSATDGKYTMSWSNDGGLQNPSTVYWYNGSKGENGKDGADGVSPTIDVTTTDTGHTVSITDVNGTQSFEVLNGTDGKDGASGSSGGGGAAITYAYDTEIATGETWIDGKPIYLKVFHIDALETAPATIDYKDYYSQTAFAETIVSVNPIWHKNNYTFTDILVNVCSAVSTTSSAVGSSVNNIIIAKMTWCLISNDSTTFKIVIGRGRDSYNATCDVFIKYTKS